MVVYLDYASTTPLDDRVFEAMKPFFSKRFGNPSSVHALGEDAKQAVEEAREQVASVINAKSDDIYFTPNATTANNIVLKGWPVINDVNGGGEQLQAIITTNTEHKSISKCLERIDRDRERVGKQIVSRGQVKIDNSGNIDYMVLEELLKQYTNYPTLVSIIAGNNVIGTINDLFKIGSLCKKYNALFHTDAVQAIGKIDIDVDKMNIFALTGSGHKIYGPKGSGFLYIRDASLIEPLIDGGYQDGLVSGTTSVPSVVGLGKACEILQQDNKENDKIGELRDYLLELLKEGIPDILVNGQMGINRLTNNLNVTIEGILAEVFVKGMDSVIVSSGSACESGDLDPSPVIIALGTPYPECAIRMSLGRWTTKLEIETAAKKIIEIVKSIRDEEC